jgi:hypothetical protein
LISTFGTAGRVFAPPGGRSARRGETKNGHIKHRLMAFSQERLATLRCVSRADRRIDQPARTTREKRRFGFTFRNRSRTPSGCVRISVRSGKPNVIETLSPTTNLLHM